MIAGPSLPPAYTAEPEPINVQQVLDKAHPRGAVEGMGSDYDEIVRITGVRCTIFEDELKLRRAKNCESPGLFPSNHVDPPSLPIKGRDRIVGYVYLDSDTLRKYGSYVVAAFTGGFRLKICVARLLTRQSDSY